MMAIPLPVIQWMSCGPDKDPKSILRGETAFFGMPYVAIAIAVEYYDIHHPATGKVCSIGQRGTTSTADIELIKWDRAANAMAAGTYETLKIESRPYVVFLRPRLIPHP